MRALSARPYRAARARPTRGAHDRARPLAARRAAWCTRTRSSARQTPSGPPDLEGWPPSRPLGPAAAACGLASRRRRSRPSENRPLDEVKRDERPAPHGRPGGKGQVLRSKNRVKARQGRRLWPAGRRCSSTGPARARSSKNHLCASRGARWARDFYLLMPDARDRDGGRSRWFSAWDQKTAVQTVT